MLCGGDINRPISPHGSNQVHQERAGAWTYTRTGQRPFKLQKKAGERRAVMKLGDLRHAT